MRARMLLPALALAFSCSVALPPEQAQAANKYWVGGTGDCSDTTHWATSTGGPGSTGVPGAGDSPIWDGASGGGVVTCAGPFTWQGVTCGAFTGTLTFTGDFNLGGASGSSWTCSGSGTRTINAGNGTWIITTVDAAPLNFGTTTGLTFNAQGSTVIIRGTTSASRSLIIDNTTWNNITIDTNTGRGLTSITGPVTISGTLNVAAGTQLELSGGQNHTVGSFLANGTSALPIGIGSSNTNAVTLTSNGAISINAATIRSITFAGSASWIASNSYDAGLNSGPVTITPPSGGGGAGVPSIGGRGQGM